MADGGGLEIDTDQRFQHRFWRFQRAAWMAMALVLVAAIAGVSGKGGHFSRATSTDGGTSINYPRISRWQTADDLVVETDSSAASAEVFLPGEFLDVVTVEGVTPEPSGVTAMRGGQSFVFALGPQQGRKTIVFSLRPARPSLPVTSFASVDDGRPLPMSFVVLP